MSRRMMWFASALLLFLVVVAVIAEALAKSLMQHGLNEGTWWQWPLILLGLVQALREADLRFPEDVALAGFDDMPWTRVVTPGITVMAQPTYDIGRSAIELLLARIAQPEQAVRRIVLRGELIVRGSSSRQA